MSINLQLGVASAPRARRAAAAVLPSIFEEQIEHEEMEVARMLDFWALSSPETSDYFPQLDNYNTGPGLLEVDRRCEAATRYADHCQSQRFDNGWLGTLCGVDRAGWCRCAGAKHLRSLLRSSGRCAASRRGVF
ncbi:MAG: hypothetical protein R3C56_16170 [Pirellulaceae bacterium]